MVAHKPNSPPEPHGPEDGPTVANHSEAGFSSRLQSCLTATNIAATLLILVGLLRAISYVTNNDAIDVLGRATAAAPRPIVFVNNVDLRCSFYAETTSGKVVAGSYGPGLMQKIRGPMWRRYIFFRAMVSIPSHPEEIERLFMILRYGMCTDHTLAEDLGIDEAIRRFRFVRWHARAPSATTAASDVMCEE